MTTPTRNTSDERREQVLDAIYNTGNDHDPVEAVLALLDTDDTADRADTADRLPVTPTRSTLGPRQREATAAAAEAAYLYAYQAMTAIRRPDATPADLDDAQRRLAAAERAARGARRDLVRRTR